MHELVSPVHLLVLARIHGNGILASAATDVSVSVVAVRVVVAGRGSPRGSR